MNFSKYALFIISIMVLNGLNGEPQQGKLIIKNNSNKNLFFSVGSKSKDPLNQEFALIQPKKSSNPQATDINSYPEIALSQTIPIPGTFVDIYEVNAYKLSPDTKFIDVQADIKDNAIKVTPQAGWFGRKIANNITQDELSYTRAIYKPKQTDPYKFLSNLVGTTTQRKGLLTYSSTPAELLGLTSIEAKNNAAIDARYQLLLQQIAYLNQHADMQSLYNSLVKILDRARKDLIAKIGK